VRGYDHLQPWLVRRRPSGDDAPFDTSAFEGMLDEMADDVLESPEDDGA
jgi:adenylate cyclase